jgi:hypothetical protein
MKKIPWLIIVALLVMIFLQRECNHETPGRTETVIRFDTIHDTVPYPVIHYQPKLIYIDTGSVKWKLQPVDTPAILAAFFAKHFYKDTLLNDTNALIVVSDTISRNRIISRSPLLRIYPHIIRQTKYIEQKAPGRRKFFLGIGAGRNLNRFGFSANILYLSKKEHGYSFSYDVLNKSFYVGMYWKIKFILTG